MKASSDKTSAADVKRKRVAKLRGAASADQRKSSSPFAREHGLVAGVDIGIGVSVPLRDAAKCVLESYNTPSRPNIVISSPGTDAQLKERFG